jgi:hypothetical protein
MNAAGQTVNQCQFVPGSTLNPVLLDLGVALRMKL